MPLTVNASQNVNEMQTNSSKKMYQSNSSSSVKHYIKDMRFNWIWTSRFEYFSKSWLNQHPHQTQTGTWEHFPFVGNIKYSFNSKRNPFIAAGWYVFLLSDKLKMYLYFPHKTALLFE